MKPQSTTMQFNAKQLRDMSEEAPLELLQRSPIYIILDNVYDTYNIGGLFRLSDALAVSELLLCGMTETPPNSRILKASIGTYKVVPWRYFNTTREAIDYLRDSVPGIQIVSIERTEGSVPYTHFAYHAPLALIAGNETHGISEDVLSASDAIVELPMNGYNISLNVIVSAAIVGYHAYNVLQSPEPTP